MKAQETGQGEIKVMDARQLRQLRKLEINKRRKELIKKQAELAKGIAPDVLEQHGYSPQTHDIIQKKTRIIIRKKKRRAKDTGKIISRNELLSLIEKIPDDSGNFPGKGKMYRALIALLYLTGARINELLTLKKDQFEYAQEKDKGIKYLIINNIPTLKRGEKIFRPVFLRKDFEDEFISHVRTWLAEIMINDAPVFNLTDARAYQIVLKYTGMYPHYFRHVRNTDLVRYYGFDTHYLQQWNGWKNAKSGDFYVHLVGEDLKERILKLDNITRKN